MPFNSKSGKKAGTVSKRGTALPIELRANLNELAVSYTHLTLPTKA